MRFITTRFQAIYQSFGFIAFVHDRGGLCPGLPVCSTSSVSSTSFMSWVFTLRQPVREVTRSHRSSVSILRPSFPLSVGLRSVFLSLQVAILSCNHPSTTKTSQWHLVSRRQAIRSARNARKLRHRATPRSYYGLSLMSKCLSHLAHSTDSLF